MTDSLEPQKPRKVPIEILLTTEETILLMEFGDTHLLGQTATAIVSNTLALWKPVRDRQVAAREARWAEENERRAALQSLLEHAQQIQQAKQAKESSETSPPANTDQKQEP